MKKMLLVLGLLVTGSSAVAMQVAVPSEGEFTLATLFQAIASSDLGTALDLIGSKKIDLNEGFGRLHETALHRAAWGGTWYPDDMSLIIERLLKEGASPDATNAEGNTALDSAISSYSIYCPGQESYFIKWLRVPLAQPHAEVLKDKDGTIMPPPYRIKKSKLTLASIK